MGTLSTSYVPYIMPGGRNDIYSFIFFFTYGNYRRVVPSVFVLFSIVF